MCQLNVCCKFTCQQNDSPDNNKLVQYVMLKDAIETLFGDISDRDKDEICEKLLSLQSFEITFNRNNIVSKCTIH